MREHDTAQPHFEAAQWQLRIERYDGRGKRKTQFFGDARGRTNCVVGEGSKLRRERGIDGHFDGGASRG